MGRSRKRESPPRARRLLRFRDQLRQGRHHRRDDHRRPAELRRRQPEDQVQTPQPRPECGSHARSSPRSTSSRHGRAELAECLWHLKCQVRPALRTNSCSVLDYRALRSGGSDLARRSRANGGPDTSIVRWLRAISQVTNLGPRAWRTSPACGEVSPRVATVRRRSRSPVVDEPPGKRPAGQDALDRRGLLRGVPREDRVQLLTLRLAAVLREVALEAALFAARRAPARPRGTQLRDGGSDSLHGTPVRYGSSRRGFGRLVKSRRMGGLVAAARSVDQVTRPDASVISDGDHPAM